MPYNPATTDRSADYIFNAMQKSQDRALEQQQLQAQQMQQASNMLMSSASQIAQNAQEDDFQRATWEGYKSILGSDAVDPKMDEKFYGGGLGSKRALNAQLGMVAKQMLQERDQAFTPAVTKLPDLPGYAFVQTGANGGQLVNTNASAADTMPRASDFQIDQNEAGEMVRINRLTGVAEPVLDATGKPVKGQPRAQSFNDFIMDGIKNEANTQSPPTMPPRPGAGVPAAASGYANPDAVRAAVRAGNLSREAGIQILREQFNMQ